MKQMSTINAGLINQFKFKYQVVFSASFYKQDEDDQVLEEIELFFRLKNNPNLTQLDINNFDVRYQKERRKWKQKTKDSDWRYHKINSLTI